MTNRTQPDDVRQMGRMLPGRYRNVTIACSITTADTELSDEAATQAQVRPGDARRARDARSGSVARQSRAGGVLPRAPDGAGSARGAEDHQGVRSRARTARSGKPSAAARHCAPARSASWSGAEVA